MRKDGKMRIFSYIFSDSIPVHESLDIFETLWFGETLVFWRLFSHM
jgi:hypothetical protein